MTSYFALGFFIFSFLVFFLFIALTLVLGGVSRMGDKRVDTEGRVSSGQRPPSDRDVPSY